MSIEQDCLRTNNDCRISWIKEGGMIEGSKDKWEEGQRRGGIERVKERKEGNRRKWERKQVSIYVHYIIHYFILQFIYFPYSLFHFILFYLSLIQCDRTEIGHSKYDLKSFVVQCYEQIILFIFFVKFYSSNRKIKLMWE